MAVDVLVVGAGPAGATAARALALAGARVRILDRYRFPRNKPCGGAISMRALKRFPYIQPELFQPPGDHPSAPAVSTRLISRLRLESPAGAVAELKSDTPAALMIRRIEFDNLLVELARRAGVELVEKVEITQAERTASGVALTSRDGVRWTAPVAIAADGANSVVARRLGFNPGWAPSAVALDMMEEVPFDVLDCADPEQLWVAYGYRNSLGYAYVFPKRTHVNVGIGYVLEHYRTAITEHPYQLQQRFVATLNRRGVLEGRSDRRCFTPALLPVGGPLRRTCDDRVMLAGDAGGFVNGFTAEGIYYAMVSGDLAAKAAIAGKPSGFARAWRKEIGAELRDSVIVQRFLFRNTSRIDAMVNGAHVHPEHARTLVDYAMGKVSYGRARARFLARFPASALSIVFDLLVSAGAWHNRVIPAQTDTGRQP